MLMITQSFLRTSRAASSADRPLAWQRAAVINYLLNLAPFQPMPDDGDLYP